MMAVKKGRKFKSSRLDLIAVERTGFCFASILNRRRADRTPPFWCKDH
jgi:hypothetical protein